MKAFVFAAVALACLSSMGCAAAVSETRVARPITLEGDRPLTVRTDAGNLWVGSHVWTDTRRAWEKPARGPIEALSIRVVGSGHEITFVQGGVVWRGEVDADHRPRGPLEPVERASELDASARALANTATRDGGIAQNR